MDMELESVFSFSADVWSGEGWRSFKFSELLSRRLERSSEVAEGTFRVVRDEEIGNVARLSSAEGDLFAL
ncbi:hypothetical protein HMI55_001274 [Coelomomyces lativittatus]|nr:hypothetical protein HMI55_001274 [Coelomomyces lativittatus]